MLYCGFDLGKKTSHFCIIDDARKIRREGRVKTGLKQLWARFGDEEPMHILVEASSKSFWVVEQFRAMGHDAKIADPGQSRAIAAGFKTDKRDARMLARLCQAEMFKEVEHVDQETRAARKVVAARDLLVRTRTSVINNVRSMLDSEGYSVPAASTSAFVDKIPTDLPPALAAALAPLVGMLRDVEARIAETDELLAAERHKRPIVKTLKTVPGVGDLTALVFALVIRDPKRFKCRREVAAYVGLAPSIYESGATSRLGRITKRGNRTLRWLLTMAAHALLRSRRDCALKRWGSELVVRAGRKKAVVAIARKLAVTLWAMWRDGRTYEPRLNLSPTA